MLEIGNLNKLKTFKKVEIPKGKQVIPVKWVFNYKFDSDGNLSKLKARLCVRGDLQIQSRDDTYAATLAAKVFRACMSLTAVFNLDAQQYDMVNAFLNSELDEEIYVRMPDGFAETGMCSKSNVYMVSDNRQNFGKNRHWKNGLLQMES
jgi:hypothetical protein